MVHTGQHMKVYYVKWMGYTVVLKHWQDIRISSYSQEELEFKNKIKLLEKNTLTCGLFAF